MKKFDLLNPEDLGVEQIKDSNFFKRMEAECFVSVEEKVEAQPVAISIGTTNYKGNQVYVPFGSYGDYSAIVGSSKSRKTFLKTALVAGYIGGNSNIYFDNILGHDTKGKYVFDIDTEQSKYHAQFAFRRVKEMVGANSRYYKSYALRRYSATERLEFIDWLMTKSPYVGNIGLVVIDGYADLVEDYNSLSESNDLQQKLLTWSADQQCHITGVLHKNFGSEKPVGHVGSAVLKKAETIAFTEKKGDETLVKCEYARNTSFKDFTFTVRKNDWLPELVSDDADDLPI